MPTPRFVSYGRSPAEITDDLRLWIVLEFFLGKRAQDAALLKAEGMSQEELASWAWRLTNDGKQYAGGSFTSLELGWTV